MGSPKVSNAKPQSPMDKPAKNPLLSSLKNLFNNKRKEKGKHDKNVKIKEETTRHNDVKTEKKICNDVKPENKIYNDVKPEKKICNDVKPEKKINNNDVKTEKKIEPEVTVANILKRFENLDIKPEKKEETERKSTEDSHCDFNDSHRDLKDCHRDLKVIEDDRRRHSSEDSGYSECKEDQEIIDSFDKLKIDKEQKEESKKEEKKKTFSVVLSRAPVRTKVSDYNVEPYAARQVNHQINKQALCGGQVFVATPDNYSEVDQALKQVQQLSQTTSNQSEYWEDVQEIIDEDSQKNEEFLKTILEKSNPEDLLEEFKEFVVKEQSLVIDVVPNVVSIPNAIEEFTESQNLPIYEETIDLNIPLLSFENVDYTKMESVFPTPPRSETVPSPMSESQASFYPPTCSTWENSLSPERSSPVYHSDYERYQEISQFEELSPVSEVDEKKTLDSVSSLTRTNSLTSMTMKNFKDMMKDISNEFSKKDCCQINRKSCKELFDEHVSRLKAVERKNLCFNVAKMDLKSAYGVLQHTILNAASASELDFQHALFALVCQRVLAQSPVLFLGEFGLNILKAAVMRCPHRPLLTRFIVHFIYAALKQESTAAAQECVFQEVDALGDNLVIACARGGDAFALVLSEITRADARGSLPPLFRIHHANTDGYTALHVACSLHSTASTRLHTLHVLLEHAQADLWKGDVKGGDTALHLAVNSGNCDLRVIMMIFKQIDRKLWKKLAHCHNMSSVTPLEYARSATKSTTRQNYPQEVLDFLKKCR